MEAVLKGLFHSKLGDYFKSNSAIPFIQQTCAADCGAACIAMVLAYHGKHIPLETIRYQSGVDKNGTNAYHLLNTARLYGLRGRGIKVEDMQDLKYLVKGTILHWQFHHFIVLDKVVKDTVYLVDPGRGELILSIEEFEKQFTGIALHLEPGEHFVKQPKRRSSAQRYIDYLKGEKSLLGRLFLVSILIQLIGLSIPLFTSVMIDRVIPRSDYDFISVLGFGVAAIALFRILSYMIRSYLFLYLRTRLDSKLTFDFVEHLIALPYSFFEQRTSGDLLMRLNSHSEIREIMTTSSLSAMIDGSLVLLYLVFLFSAHTELGLLVLLLGAARIAVFVISKNRHKEVMSSLLQTQAASRGYQVQMLNAMETLKSQGREEYALEKWAHYFSDELNVNIKQGKLNAFTEAALDLLSIVSPLILLIYSGSMVMAGEMSLGTMMAVIALAAGFLLPLTKLVETGINIQRVRSYIERVDDVLNCKKEQTLEERNPPPVFRGDIDLKSVSFQYNQFSPAVISDINLSIKAGEFVAIVGSSGSGKSTLARILCGMYKPTSGAVCLDGQNVHDFDLRLVRQQLGIVQQSPYIFGASIRENISGQDNSKGLSAVIEAAKQAALHQDIMALPMGYNSVLSDNGSTFSGGQKQRLAIAKALYHQPKILLLDEATSALDVVSERKVQTSFKKLRATRIVIAHRLSTIKEADKILVLDQGRIVEQGNHESLYQQGGLYRALVEADNKNGATAQTDPG